MRMCLSSDFCFSCRAGAAVLSGRMLPVDKWRLVHVPAERILEMSYAEQAPRDPTASRGPSSSCPLLGPARVPGLLPGGSLVDLAHKFVKEEPMIAYGAALVSSRMCLSFRSCGSGRVWRCFSRESRRSRVEMGVVSTGLGWVFSAMIAWFVGILQGICV